MRPRTPRGSPGLREISVHVSPPSVDFHSDESGPPLAMPHGERRACQIAAKSTRGLLGSSERSTAPASSLLKSTCSHVLPPFFERNTPRSRLGAHAWPSAAT